MNYKLGKLPAREGAIKFKLVDYTTTLPKAPQAFTHDNLVNDWGMLGNDQYGDCVWAGAGHETMLWNKEATKTVYITEKNALDAYSAVTGFNPEDPNTDQGTDMELAAKYRRKVGIKDSTKVAHKVAAYVDVTAGNLEELKLATYLFSAVGMGIKFPGSAMTQFNNGKPWDVVKNAKIKGGHYVPIVGYDDKYFYVVTWGKLQPVTYDFVRKYMDEGIAYLSDDFLTNNKSSEGFDSVALQKDLNSL